MIKLEIKGRKVLVRLPLPPSTELKTDSGLVLPSVDLQGNSINNKDIIKQDIYNISCEVVEIGDKVDTLFSIGDQVMVSPDAGYIICFPDPNNEGRELQIIPQDLVLCTIKTI
jgi:hypothetical protein